MTIPLDIKFFLKTIMSNIFTYHREIDTFATEHSMYPGEGPVKVKCDNLVDSLDAGNFTSFIEDVLSYESPFSKKDEDMLFPQKAGLVRAIKMHGYDITCSSGNWQISKKIGSERMEKTKIEVKDLLNQLGFEAVKKDLELAEKEFIGGNFTQSLVLSKKAFEDTCTLISEKLNIDRTRLFSEIIDSESGKEILVKIYYYSCKSHNLILQEYEAIFGYHLVLSSINFLIMIYNDRKKD